MSTRLIAAIMAAAISAVAFIAPAGARPHPERNSAPAVQHFCGDRYCSPQAAPGKARVHARQGKVRPAAERRRLAQWHRAGPSPRRSAAKQRAGHPRADAAPSEEAQIVEHPAGCPHRSFCGCGTSLFLLGKAVAQGGLAIARNWLGFPEAEPGPGMAAARSGHVFAILRVLSPGKVLAYDPNSGGHQTRVHVRSLAGYKVVNPRGENRYADLK